MSLNKFTEAEELADNAMCARENPLSRAMKARCLVVFARARARDGRLSRAQSAVDEALRLDPNVEGASELRTKLLHLLAPSVAVTGDTKHIHKNSAAAAAVANVESADRRDRAIPAPRAPIAMSDLAVGRLDGRCIYLAWNGCGDCLDWDGCDDCSLAWKCTDEWSVWNADCNVGDGQSGGDGDCHLGGVVRINAGQSTDSTELDVRGGWPMVGRNCPSVRAVSCTPRRARI